VAKAVLVGLQGLVEWLAWAAKAALEAQLNA
jgi:hypothetical protein